MAPRRETVVPLQSKGRREGRWCLGFFTVSDPKSTSSKERVLRICRRPDVNGDATFPSANLCLPQGHEMLLTECDGPEPLTHLLCLCTNPGLPVVQGWILRDPASLKAFKVSDNAVWGCVRLLTVYTGKGVLLPLWKLAELYHLENKNLRQGK